MRLTEDEANRVMESLLQDLASDKETLVCLQEACITGDSVDASIGNTAVALIETALTKLQLLKDLLAKSDAPSLNAMGNALIGTWSDLEAAIKQDKANDN